MTDEQMLALNVIIRAINDAVEKLGYKTTSWEYTRSKDIEESRMFICSNSKGWKQSREDWCAMAGFPADWLQKWGLEMEAKGWDSKELKKKIKSVLNEVE